MGGMTESESKEAFGQRLRHARQVRGYSTASDFARQLGVKVHTYAKWEQGENLPAKTAQLIQICRELGVSSDWLLSGDERHLTVEIAKLLSNSDQVPAPTS